MIERKYQYWVEINGYWYGFSTKEGAMKMYEEEGDSLYEAKEPISSNDLKEKIKSL